VSQARVRSAPVAWEEEADVFVAGGGVAGVFAALAAAERGMSVTLVEPSSMLGGQATAGGVAGFCGDTRRVNRAFDALVARLAERSAIAPYEPNADRRGFDLWQCAFALQEMLEERGVRLLLHSRVIGVDAARGAVSAAFVATACEVGLCRARFFVDATGACALAVAASFEVFHEGALAQLPASLCFTLWDTGRPVEPFLPEGCPRWSGDDELPMTTVHERPDGRVEVKMKVVGFDAADGRSLSEAELHARRQMMALVYHLQTRGYRDRRYDRHVLAAVSPMIGVREQRRIVAEHVLTKEEVTHGCVFEDAVAVGTYHLDYHWPDRAERSGTGITTAVEPYHIPLRSLIPRGARNLLVPGRAAGGDQMAMSSFRVMATCAQTGYAAGCAASRAIRERRPVARVDIAALQSDLALAGQALDLSQYGEYLRAHITTHEHMFGEDRPFESCHASTLAQLPEARFFVAWFGGTREGAEDVAIWGTERFKGRWGPVRRLAKVADAAHWNPVLFRAPDGRLHLFFKVGPNPRCWTTWTVVSEDDGRTWDEPRELVPGDVGGRGPAKNKPIVLSDGTWLAPGSVETDESWRVFVDRSEDGGRTWTAGEPIAVDESAVNGKGVIQPTLWESEPGRVHMLMRATCGQVCRSDSADGGRTWSVVRPTVLPNNNSGLDLARLEDGTLALALNPVRSGRTPLSIALSFDNGLTWPRRLDVETGPGEYSYPSVIPTARGMAVTYTWRRERIAFWHGSVEQIPDL